MSLLDRLDNPHISTQLTDWVSNNARYDVPGMDPNLIGLFPQALTVQGTGRTNTTASGYREAMTFIRQFHNGRYSDSTIMSFIRAADRVDADEQQGMDFNPSILRLSAPVDYNENTEVKVGGMVAILALLPGEAGNRGVVVVHPDYRRRKLGSLLFGVARYYFVTNNEPLSLWAGRDAVEAGQFALSVGCSPNVITPGGSIEYIFGGNRIGRGSLAG